MVDILFMCLLGSLHFETLEMSAKMMSVGEEQQNYEDVVASALLGMESPETSHSRYGLVKGMRPLVAATFVDRLCALFATSPRPPRSSCCIS